jgi:hypothetical protein
MDYKGSMMKTELNEDDIKKAIKFYLFEHAHQIVEVEQITLYKDSTMTEQIYADIQMPEPKSETT